MDRMRCLQQFEFHHVLEETPGVSLVFFKTRACGSCKSMQIVLEEYLETNHDLHIFIVDAEHDLALTREFDVFHLPAMFLYINGRFHRELHAEATLERFDYALKHTLGLPSEEAP